MVPQCLQGLSAHELHGAPLLCVTAVPADLTSTALWRSDVVVQGLDAAAVGSAATGPSWRGEHGFLSSEADATTGLTSASSVCAELQRGVRDFLADKCFRMLHWREMTPWSHLGGERAEGEEK